MHVLARVNSTRQQKGEFFVTYWCIILKMLFIKHVSGAAALAILNSIGRLHKIKIC
jgi:hypothetical protein